MSIRLRFDKGSLLLDGVEQEIVDTWTGVKYDNRVRLYRASANCYRDIVMDLRRRKLTYTDDARQFEPLDLPLAEPIQPRQYQRDALAAWSKGKRGLVVLPTGAGKTILAVLAMQVTRRPTLIHVPTIDLMHQWHDVLTRFFDRPIGRWGGGHGETEAITVSTYDSAVLRVNHGGNRFGLVIYDECHHLPGEQVRLAASGNLAPFRLGLTATPERKDGGEAVLFNLVGPIDYRVEIHQLTGGTLAPYDVETIEVDMDAHQRQAYESAREIYIGYLRKHRIRIGSSRDWQQFVWRASLSKEGRRAFQAYLAQKRLSQAADAKLDTLWHLLTVHRQERILIFTHDNEMAYRIGCRFFLPVITHRTKLKEREAWLTAFRSGELPVMVTSRVLNEGVDVPEAGVAIVVSGSGSVREHVQRLGRILRAQPGKRAVLYELVAADTGETFVNKRRKQHHAYQGSDSL